MVVILVVHYDNAIFLKEVVVWLYNHLLNNTTFLSFSFLQVFLI